MILTINLNSKEYPVEVIWKNIKKVRLKVFASGEIKLSVPDNTPESWVADFLTDKKSWLEKKIEVFEMTRPIEKEEHIVSGCSTRVLGRQITIYVVRSNKKGVIIEDSSIIISTTEDNQADIDKQFNNWWQRQAKQYYQSVLDKLYPIISRHNIIKPTILVAKMQTLWGSCSRKLCKINLNYYLYKASVACIEYVVFHEMVHLMYPNHDKNFYEFLTIYMPDWQERKKQLDYEFVLGV